mmetsp:Transcript_13972/g.41643  ORF Transcript_13972/g.41643 Transcript_13972/m.41643 type:complete len:196 (-) Transcript_13972:1093-1680(-)
MASALAGAVVFAANRYSPAFRRALGVSGQSALVVMAGLGYGSLQAELFLGHRKDWEPSHEEVTRETQRMQEEKDKPPFVPHLRLANFVYRHPFQCIAGIGGSAVGYIFWKHRHTRLSLLQQILHTRVAGQASVLATLAGIMFFREWMDRRGGAFEIPGDTYVEEVPVESFGRFARIDIKKQLAEERAARKAAAGN